MAFLRFGGCLLEMVRITATHVHAGWSNSKEDMFFVVSFADLKEVLQTLGDELKVLHTSDSHPTNISLG